MVFHWKRKTLYIVILIVLTVTAVGILYITLQSSDDSPPAEIDTPEEAAAVEDFREKFTQISDIAVDTPEMVLGKNIPVDEKIFILIDNAALKISLGRYIEAQAQLEAAYGLKSDNEQTNDQVAYRLLLVYEELDNAEGIAVITNDLGQEKIEALSNPESRTSEAE